MTTLISDKKRQKQEVFSEQRWAFHNRIQFIRKKKIVNIKQRKFKI